MTSIARSSTCRQAATDFSGDFPAATRGLPRARRAKKSRTPAPASQPDSSGKAPRQVLVFVVGGGDLDDVGTRVLDIVRQAIQLGIAFTLRPLRPICVDCSANLPGQRCAPAVIYDPLHHRVTLDTMCFECAKRIGADREVTRYAWVDVRGAS